MPCGQNSAAMKSGTTDFISTTWTKRDLSPNLLFIYSEYFNARKVAQTCEFEAR